MVNGFKAELPLAAYLLQIDINKHLASLKLINKEPKVQLQKDFKVKNLIKLLNANFFVRTIAYHLVTSWASLSPPLLPSQPWSPSLSRCPLYQSL